jgi:Protein of unknown function (DUF4054)
MASSHDVFAFRAQFPEFATVKDADLAATLNTADVFLDASQWSPRDFATARMYWVAHMLTLQQMQGASVELGGTGMADLFLRQVRIGERTVGFGQRQFAKAAASGAGPGEEMLAYTYYGQLFVQLRSRNIIAIAVV